MALYLNGQKICNNSNIIIPELGQEKTISNETTTIVVPDTGYTHIKKITVTEPEISTLIPDSPYYEVNDEYTEIAYNTNRLRIMGNTLAMPETISIKDLGALYGCYFEMNIHCYEKGFFDYQTYYNPENKQFYRCKIYEHGEKDESGPTIMSNHDITGCEIYTYTWYADLDYTTFDFNVNVPSVENIFHFPANLETLPIHQTIIHG